MAHVQEGNSVQVHYTGKLEDGTVFDSSLQREPLEFTVGSGLVIPGFEEAVLGMKVGESKMKTIPAEEAYGPRREDLVITIPKSNVPGDFEPEAGQQVQLQLQDGSNLIAEVLDATEEDVTLDANHPLAGQALIFNIQLIELN